MNRTIRSGTRKVIYNVYMRCLAEAQAGKILSDLSDVYKRVAEMTGKSESTIRRIAEEGSKNNGVFSTPGKNRKGRPKKQLDDFDISAIRQKVHFFYSVKKEMPTLSKLQAVLKEDIGYDGCREHLRKLLISIGFRYKKCQSQRSVLIEQPLIAHKRERYLKFIMDNRNLPPQLQKNIIYLDESYIHSSYKLKKCWQSIETKGVLADVSKGKRWIIVHAGSEKGFVPNALLIFSGKNKNEDYHSEMNQHNFRKWVLEKLVPNLEEPSIIVMDNAPYHSVVKNKAPTSASRIDEIKMWLQENKISFDPFLRKPSLLILAKQHKQEPIYEIDEILGEYGHTVVRLPPYHCDLNPIEQIWALAKQKIASRNVGASDIKMLTEKAFQEITENDWKNCCNHVKKIELEYYERGRTMYEDIEKFIIQVTNDSEIDTSHSDFEACMDIQTYSEVHRNEEGASTSVLDVQYLDYSFSD